MIRLWIYLCVLIISLPLAAKDVPFNSLPKEAVSFITTHFGELKVEKVKLESGVYVVDFTNDYELAFDSKGNWIVVDCDEDAVPKDIIPQAILEFVSKNFVGDVITQIEQSKGEYNIELQSDVSLLFDKKGKFLKLGN